MEMGIKRGRGESTGAPRVPALGAESKPRRQPWKKQEGGGAGRGPSRGEGEGGEEWVIPG